MIIKLTDRELEELRRFETRPFGDDTFESFMAEMHARVNENGEIDIDRDDRERIADYVNQGHQEALDAIFKRSISVVFKEFLD